MMSREFNVVTHDWKRHGSVFTLDLSCEEIDQIPRDIF